MPRRDLCGILVLLDTFLTLEDETFAVQATTSALASLMPHSDGCDSIHSPSTIAVLRLEAETTRPTC